MKKQELEQLFHALQKAVDLLPVETAAKDPHAASYLRAITELQSRIARRIQHQKLQEKW